jgi:hypothetical protein
MQPQQGKTEQDDKGSDQPDMVITPAGPVRKDKVHPVKPGEVVIRNPDGSYSVVPKPKQ